MKMNVEEIRDDWENFPVGLRVLAVDDDPICLKLLETQLRKCQYHVTATSQARMALNLLRENKSRFDLVISDVYMPDMDGFKLLELVGLEMDLPVIMLSANGDPKLVMKGVTHGACDYLVKPVRIEELRNIWQHVIRKKKIDPKNRNKSSDQSKDGEESGDGQGSPLTGNTDHNGKFNRKRKDEDYESEDNGNESEDAGTQKKPRVVWSIDLHRKFVAAVNQLGIESEYFKLKAVPKRILDMMNVDGLTRENVASHLQKYRLYLKRISTVASQQANMAAALGIKNSTFMHMGSLDGLGDYRTLSGPRLSNVTLSPFTSNGMLGRLNTPTNVNLHNLTPSPNLTSSLSSLGKKHLVLPPANQNPANLFQGIPSSSELDNKNGASGFNTLDGTGFFPNVGSFSDLGAVLGSSRNLLNSNNIAQHQVLNGVGGFGNPSATNFSSESFNAGSSNLLGPVKCDDSWRNAIESSKMHENNRMLPTDAIGFSSGMGLVTSEQRRDYAHGPINNNNNYGSLNSIVSTLGRNLDQNNGILNKKVENIFVNGRSSRSGSTLIESERSDTGLRASSGHDFIMEQPKLQGGVGRHGYDSLDELMNAMIKREHDDIIPNCDFGLDDYSFGQAI